MSLGAIFHFPLSFVFISMMLVIIAMVVMISPVERFFTKERVQQLFKIIFGIFFILLLLVLVGYVIYVTPYLFVEEDVEKITPIISAIAGIVGVVITVLLFYTAFKTLAEMEKQRNISNTPRLHVTSSSNRISMEAIPISSEDGETLPAGWKNAKLSEESGRDIILEPNLDFLEPIKIVNTGLSPALNVEIKWRLTDDYIKEIAGSFNTFFPDIRFEVYRPKEHYEIRVQYRVYRFTKESINKKYECVLSYSTKEDTTEELHIPRQLYVLKFIEMCGEYVKQGSSSHLGTPPSPQGVYSSESAFSNISITLSPLIADITYSDNISSKHKGELHVNFRLVVSNERCNYEGIMFKKGTLIVESELRYN